MILEEETFEAFGYYPKDLTHGSNKHIKATCDKCGKIRTTSKNTYCPLCRSCSMKGNTYCLGYKHTEDHKAAMKCNRNALGHIYAPSEETKSLIRVALKGNTNALGHEHTNDTKAKIRAARKGRKHTEETKALISKNHADFKGEKSGMWKGGISFEPYCVKFNNAFKEYIRLKFGYTCFLCPITQEENGRKLGVHHVNYNKNCGCDGDLTCQFVPLCMACHAKTNGNRDYWQKIITDKLHNTIIGWDV